MPDGGQQVDPYVLRQTAQFVRDAPKEALEHVLPPLKDIQLRPDDFGRAHHGCHQLFVNGMNKIVDCVNSYQKASDDFAGNLGGAGRAYSANEDQNAAAAREAGRA